MRGNAIKVLLVEDSAADAQVTSDMLVLARAPRCELTRADRLTEARALLALKRFDVVLLDLGLPDVVGLDGVHALRGAAPETAIIVLSGIGSEAIAVTALEAGAQDYLVKGRCDEDGLQRSIRFAIARREADVAQRRFAAIVESSEDAIFTKDLDTTITSWNSGAQRLYGYTALEAIGSPVAILIPPERHGEEHEILARVLAGERVDHYETTRVCKDGTTKIVSLTVSAIRDAQGGVLAISSIARDITESTRAARLLRAAQERFRVSFEEAPIGMLNIGLDGRYERVNDAFCAIVGFTHGQLAGVHRESITHPDDVAADAAALHSLLAGEATSHASEKRYLHASGHAVWAAINLTLIRDAGGHPLHFIGQVQDITERRHHERQLQHMADHDPLTGLLNRRSFERELNAHVSRVVRYGPAGALLLLDLDHFKDFNDSQGHNAGDKLIVRIAHGLRLRLRGSDVLARLGGDEFAILLPVEDEREARVVAEALLQVVRDEATAAALTGMRKPVTASVGIARFGDGERLSAEETMVNADLAMYEAKAAGRDRWARYRTQTARAPEDQRSMTSVLGPV